MVDDDKDRENRALLSMFLRNFKRDTDDGISLRSLHNKIDEHSEEDRRLFGEISSMQRAQGERIAKVETTAGHLSEADLAERQWGAASGTGRFQISPPTPPAMVPIHIDMGGRNGNGGNGTGRRDARRDSWNPFGLFAGATAKSAIKKLGSLGGLTIAGWAIGHFLTAPASPPRVVTVPVPSEVSLSPVVVVEAAQAALSASASAHAPAPTAPADAMPAPPRLPHR